MPTPYHVLVQLFLGRTHTPFTEQYQREIYLTATLPTDNPPPDED
jgi:hypothetical protein